jgi:surface protein
VVRCNINEDWVNPLSSLEVTKWTTTYGDIKDWDTSAVPDMRYVFSTWRNRDQSDNAVQGNLLAAEFTNNLDLSKWDTSAVTTLESAFHGAAKLTVNLAGWDTSAVGSLKRAFYYAAKLNSDLSSWDVGTVTTLEETFTSATVFVGTGLDQWNPSEVTTLRYTFRYTNVNADVGKWATNKVTSMYGTFNNAYVFKGTGVDKWNIEAVTTGQFGQMMVGASSLTPCNKKKIHAAWSSASTFSDFTASNSVAAAWGDGSCPVRESCVLVRDFPFTRMCEYNLHVFLNPTATLTAPAPLCRAHVFRPSLTYDGCTSMLRLVCLNASRFTPPAPLAFSTAGRRHVQAGLVGLGPGHGDGDGEVGPNRRLERGRGEGLPLHIFHKQEPGRRIYRNYKQHRSCEHRHHGRSLKQVDNILGDHDGGCVQRSERV